MVPTGIALVAPTPSQAQDLLEAANDLKPITGEVLMERQEKRLNYLLFPVPKYGYNAWGNCEALTYDEIQQELETEKISSESIYAMSWTRRSNESSNSDGTLRLVIKASSIKNLPNYVRLFARAARLRPADDRPQIPTCSNCHGFHNVNTCTRRPRCALCAAEPHDGTCSTLPKCLNCRGPHPTATDNCPARPRRENGTLVRPDKERLRQIRQQGHKAWQAKNPLTTEVAEKQNDSSTPNDNMQTCESPIITAQATPTRLPSPTTEIQL